MTFLLKSSGNIVVHALYFISKIPVLNKTVPAFGKLFSVDQNRICLPIRVNHDTLMMDVGRDFNRGVAIIHSRYEDELSFIDEFRSPLDVVVDVGAHIGYYSIRLARKSRIVLAIEPHP